MKNKAVFNILKVLTNLGIIDKIVADTYYVGRLTELSNKMREKWIGQ